MASSNVNMDLLSSWISDINKESELAEAKRRSPDARQEAAFCTYTVADADALRDLVENPDDPFLFRKWLQLRIAEGPADIRDCKDQVSTATPQAAGSLVPTAIARRGG